MSGHSIFPYRDTYIKSLSQSKRVMLYRDVAGVTQETPRG